MKHEPDSVKSGRRAFLRGAGAVASAAVVPGASTAAAPTPDATAAIRQLYVDYAAGLASQTAIHGTAVQVRMLADPAQPADTIELAADSLSARACFHCVLQTDTPLVGSASLFALARLQGQHHETRWESGAHELDCVKVDGQWQIRTVVFRGTGPFTLR